jgi:hypothetical protein
MKMLKFPKGVLIAKPQQQVNRDKNRGKNIFKKFLRGYSL